MQRQFLQVECFNSCSTTTTFHIKCLRGAKIFFSFPIISIFGALASETCNKSRYYTHDRRTFFKSLYGAQDSRESGII